MGFWIFMLIMDLLLPFTMIGFGRYFMKKAPKEINSVFGYRTSMSMKNKDTSIKLQKASENIANLRRTSTIKQIEQNSTKMPNNSTYQTAVISWVNAYKATETVTIAASRRTAKKIQALLTESFRTFISAPLRSTYSPYHIPF